MSNSIWIEKKDGDGKGDGAMMWRGRYRQTFSPFLFESRRRGRMTKKNKFERIQKKVFLFENNLDICEIFLKTIKVLKTGQSTGKYFTSS
jgi:hypothetical protein